MKIIAVLALLSLGSLSAAAQKPTPEQNPATDQKAANALVDRVGATGFIQVQAPSFHTLDAKQKHLAYWLTEAAIAVDPIIYDQLSRFGVRQKRLLEGVVAHPQGIDAATMRSITAFAKLFWANRGNHNEMTAQKFLPEFTVEQLKGAARTAQQNGAFRQAYGDLRPLPTPQALNQELDGLQASLFDPNFEPMTTAKSPQGGKDIIEASSNTFYFGVSQADLKSFKEQYPLNSRVVKGHDGKLSEVVYRAGTADGRVKPGISAVYLKRAIGYLQKAEALASPDQAQVIGKLIRFYQTGDFNDWLAFGSAWVQNNPPVDFANGFIEVYRDARGAKGSSQAFVAVTDMQLTNTMVKLAENAQYFEQKAPWLEQYKKRGIKSPVVKAVETLAETGDFHVTTIGDNLPNENQIRERYGSKNFLFTAASRALTTATGDKVIEEFGANPEVIARYKKYGEAADELHTAMHEVIGHGSGKLSPRLQGGSEHYLKEYFSTLEEARADLMSLWNAWDPKLKELGLVADQDEIAKAMYDSAALVVLTQLRRIPQGDTIEEDHQRNRALIANYVMEKTGAIRMFERDGKSYIEVTDYQKMRQGVGQLLAELMRIKAEGDYGAVKALVDKYGVHFDPKLRDQVLARYQALDLPTYWAGVNPELSISGASVKIQYLTDPVRQYLNYASMYDPSVAPKSSASPAGAAESKPGRKSKAKRDKVSSDERPSAKVVFGEVSWWELVDRWRFGPTTP